MQRLPYLAKVEATLPVTIDDIWSIIRDLDEAGPWTAGDVSRATNLNAGLPRDVVRRLKAAGYVDHVGSRTTGGKNPQRAPLYRLNRRPVSWPRLQRDGSSAPEPIIETLWRTAKMAKAFTADELAALAARDGVSVNPNTARSYCDRLVGVGVLARSLGPNRRTMFRLVRNLGRRAPKVLAAKVVFDPNSGEVLGKAELAEVRP